MSRCDNLNPDKERTRPWLSYKERTAPRRSMVDGVTDGADTSTDTTDGLDLRSRRQRPLKGGGGADQLWGGAGNDTADSDSLGLVQVNLTTGIGYEGTASGDVLVSIGTSPDPSTATVCGETRRKHAERARRQRQPLRLWRCRYPDWRRRGRRPDRRHRRRYPVGRAAGTPLATSTPRPACSFRWQRSASAGDAEATSSEHSDLVAAIMPTPVGRR